MPNNSFIPLSIVVLTISDTRTEDNDTSGKYLCEALTSSGHHLVEKTIVSDEKHLIIQTIQPWIADESIDVVLCTGGTGLTHRDVTPEAFELLVEKWIPGFGELFRYLSFKKIGVSTIQSRACAGTAHGTLLFALPGSTGACKDAWEGILKAQLDIRSKPCNFAEILPRMKHLGRARK
ncbi:MAG: molybdenum cofactor biosynthesis protein B [Proteobacteria bacterium]|nr:molybdenum cofactor biosynthesis protein B [Pseudomonadota bacterium]